MPGQGEGGQGCPICSQAPWHWAGQGLRKSSPRVPTFPHEHRCHRHVTTHRSPTLPTATGGRRYTRRWPRQSLCLWRDGEMAHRLEGRPLGWAEASGPPLSLRQFLCPGAGGGLDGHCRQGACPDLRGPTGASPSSLPQWLRGWSRPLKLKSVSGENAKSALLQVSPGP